MTSTPSTEEKPRKRSPRVCASKPIDYDDKKHLLSSPLKRERPQHDDTVVVEGGLTELEQRMDDHANRWETDSMFEDIIEDLTEDKFFTDDPEACTPEESVQLRQMLRSLGPEEFCKRTVDAGFITAKKLLTAFGIRPPDFLEGSPDDAYFSLLTLALTRELGKRIKLQKYNTVDDAADLLRTAKNVIVLTGAGISTSLGIPDFRSKGTGLYSKLEHLGLSDPQEVFDIRVFNDDPSIFYTIAKDILPSQDRFSPTHRFIRLLQDKGKLLTNYSQNIDNLEARAGIDPAKLVQCHGSFATASCVKCGHKVPGESIFPEVKAGKIPRCRKCALGSRKTANSSRTSLSSSTSSNKNKRKIAKDGTEKKIKRRPGDFDSNSDSEFDVPGDIGSVGVMKPDITFFGEKLPDEFGDRLAEHDRHQVDLCVVIGTSLKVAPVSEVVSFLPPGVPQIYISRTPVGHVNFDIDLLGDCDVVVAELCRRLGWELDHEMVPGDQRVEVEVVEGFQSRWVFTQTEPRAEEEEVKDVVLVKGEGGGCGEWDCDEWDCEDAEDCCFCVIERARALG
ncbi:SIR2-domain-containing protein [Coniochaeta ligniaria NRRL 30616]|uniref:SIR2-domain-containing protein n=1 Tax=Coniochaeta ligniaria NRRL 30616 TaxID=1408157 RepID=A0A1J7IBT8_9PEZI|nr:SIR2-domain-containing protein [Coniochaeta ligniaria NRRL 30616]